MDIKPFFDKKTSTFTYLIIDKDTSKAILIDSVLNYDPSSGKVSTESADDILNFINSHKLEVIWILETHIHADHLTAAWYIKNRVGGKIGIGERVKEILKVWGPIFNNFEDTPMDASQFDYLFQDQEKFSVGKTEVNVIYTPGHTPSCVSYRVDDALFVGDILFMPYLGTGRCDFPGGDPKISYQSIQKIFSFSDNTRIFTGHDYPLLGKAPQCESTVSEQKMNNILINTSILEEDYIKIRTQKDKNRPFPSLLFPSLQVNLRAGSFGKPEKNGTYYIKTPLKICF